MEQDRGERDRERDEVWGEAREVPPAGEEWEARGSEQGESVSVPIVATGFPMRSAYRAMKRSAPTVETR